MAELKFTGTVRMPNGAALRSALMPYREILTHLEIWAVETRPCGVASNRKMSCRRGA